MLTIASAKNMNDAVRDRLNFYRDYLKVFAEKKYYAPYTRKC